MKTRLTWRRWPPLEIPMNAVAGALTDLRDAQDAASPLDTASFESIDALNRALVIARNTVGMAVETAEKILSATPDSVGHVAVGQSGSANVAAFLAYLGVAEQASDIIDMAGYLDRIQANFDLEIQHDHGSWVGVLTPVPVPADHLIQ